LKGKEIKMPKGLFFTDKDGTQRSEIRVKWWEDPEKMTYRNISIEPLSNLPDSPVDLSLLKNKKPNNPWRQYPGWCGNK